MIDASRAIGFMVALTATAGVVWASNTPLTPHAPDAVLRLTWSARPERIETCRSLTADELATLPAHMRLPVVCEGESAAYRLEVRRNGTVVLDRVVHGGGWRRDRPLYVFEEISQPPGDAIIGVTFERIDSGTIASAGALPDPQRRLTSDLPARLMIERQIHFRPRSVVLVVFDPVRQELVVRSD